METREKSVVAENATNDLAPNPVAEAVTASAEPIAAEPAMETAQAPGTADEHTDEAILSENTPAADNVDTECTTPQATSKEDVIASLERMADDGNNSEISREDIARLKQQFYAFRKTEIEAEQAAFVAAGNDETAFIPSPDADEERFKELLNRVRDRKAAIAAAQEAERLQNFERKKPSSKSF